MLQRWTQWAEQYPWLNMVLEIALFCVLAWAIRKFVIAWLRRVVRRTTNTLDDQLVELMNRALVPLLILGVFDAVLNLRAFPARFLAVSNRIVYLGVLLVAFYYGTRVVRLLVERWLARTVSRSAVREPAMFALRVLIAAFGVMMILDNLGISLTAVWTTLGVGSVAVALALQDTLSNFFAGVYVHLDNPVRLDDYVKLGSGNEGFVIRIGWRSTRIRTPENNIIVVPNSKLASSVITNYSLPEAQMSIVVSVSVTLSSDTKKVKSIVLEEAQRIAKEVPSLQAGPEPEVRFVPDQENSSLETLLIWPVNSVSGHFRIQHELGECIQRRLQAEGIELRGQGSAKSAGKADENDEAENAGEDSDEKSGVAALTHKAG